MIGEKFKINYKDLFTKEFIYFYKQASKKTFIRHPYIKGIKKLNNYLRVYTCINYLNKIYNINIDINHFIYFKDLKSICDDWENHLISKYIEMYLQNSFK